MVLIFLTRATTNQQGRMRNGLPEHSASAWQLLCLAIRVLALHKGHYDVKCLNQEARHCLRNEHKLCCEHLIKFASGRESIHWNKFVKVKTIIIITKILQKESSHTPSGPNGSGSLTLYSSLKSRTHRILSHLSMLGMFTLNPSRLLGHSSSFCDDPTY